MLEQKCAIWNYPRLLLQTCPSYYADGSHFFFPFFFFHVTAHVTITYLSFTTKSLYVTLRKFLGWLTIENRRCAALWLHPNYQSPVWPRGSCFICRAGNASLRLHRLPTLPPSLDGVAWTFCIYLLSFLFLLTSCIDLYNKKQKTKKNIPLAWSWIQPQHIYW